MDNVKKFEDFLDRMQGLLDNAKKQGHIIVRIEDLENAFPELKEPEDEKIRKEMLQIAKESEDSFYMTMTPNKRKTLIAWLEKQGEQKPADKVEPKFKVGDFIVSDYCMGRIVEITNDAYLLDTEQGIPFSSHSTRLWDVTKDAKDGDVLVASDGSIFIFESVVDCACKHYVALTTDNVVKFNEGLEHYWETSTAVHPATKEQRDTLLKAMTDAGYTFDFEKKKLKKIEQKHTPKYKVGNTVYYDSFGRLVSFVIANIIEDGTDNPMYEDKEGNAVFEKDLIEQKPAEWSEEDDMVLNSILDSIQREGVLEKKRKTDWLKSLKDRVQPQNHWKPSDEQILALNYVVNLMASSESPKENDYYYNVFNDLREQLKKLKQ